MSITITKGMAPEQIADKLRKIKPKSKGLDVSKYLGKVKWKEDHLAFQQELRGE